MQMAEAVKYDSRHILGLDISNHVRFQIGDRIIEGDVFNVNAEHEFASRSMSDYCFDLATARQIRRMEDSTVTVTIKLCDAQINLLRKRKGTKVLSFEAAED